MLQRARRAGIEKLKRGYDGLTHWDHALAREQARAIPAEDRPRAQAHPVRPVLHGGPRTQVRHRQRRRVLPLWRGAADLGAPVG
eukprot:1716239-Lingulodinium_polyedra.AAC.1